MNEGYIYLATPYNHPDPAVMEARFDLACRVAGKLMARGIKVFCPIAHTHPIAVRCELPRGWEFWRAYDYAMLRGSSKLVIVTMDGWDRSTGIAGEIEIAGELGLSVEYVDENGDPETASGAGRLNSRAALGNGQDRP